MFSVRDQDCPCLPVWFGASYMEKEMVTHPSILAWKTPWTEEPGRLQSMGLQGVRQDWDFTFTFTYIPLGFPGGASGKDPACQYRRQKRHEFHLWVRKIPRRKKWQPTPVFLPGTSHGQRRLVHYSSWGHKRIGLDWVAEHTHPLTPIQCDAAGEAGPPSCGAAEWQQTSDVPQAPACLDADKRPEHALSMQMGPAGIIHLFLWTNYLQLLLHRCRDPEPNWFSSRKDRTKDAGARQTRPWPSSQDAHTGQPTRDSVQPPSFPTLWIRRDFCTGVGDAQRREILGWATRGS